MQEKYRVLKREADDMDLRNQILIEDQEKQIDEKNQIIKELNKKLDSGSLIERSLLDKQMEVFAGKILEYFNTIFKEFELNQNEYYNLDINACFELLFKLIVKENSIKKNSNSSTMVF